MKCKKCNSENIQDEEGFSQRTNHTFVGPRCGDCGAWNFPPKSGGFRSPTSVAQLQSDPVLKEILMELKKLNARPHIKVNNNEGEPFDPRTEEEVPF